MAWPDDSCLEERVNSPEGDGCWESARSSWIYMEMEPLPEGCPPRHDEDSDEGDDDDNDGDKTAVHLGDELDAAEGIMGCTAMSREDHEVIDEEEEEEEDDEEDDEGDYATIEDDSHEKYSTSSSSALCLKLHNGNFMLRRDDSVSTKCKPMLSFDQRRVARRSVSLDAYPYSHPSRNLMIKQSETISFSPIIDRPRELPGLRFQALQRLPHRLSITYPPSSSSSGSPHTNPGGLEADVDRHSMASVCTVATVSTTSCNSLYRIPAKMRKLSSTSSYKSAKTPDSQSKTPATFHSSPTALSKLLQDVMSSLWSDNPDRDPYNTFAVSESELTSAIAHLEHQLSSSTRGSSQGHKSRASLLNSFFVNAVDAYKPSSSCSGAPPSYLPLPPPPSCPLPDIPLSGSLPGDAYAKPKMSSLKEDPGEKELPFRVQFIMESYCNNVFMMRKQDMRELKLLQKQENKQIVDLQYKNHLAVEGKEKKFETDITNLKKQSDQDLDVLVKQQKQVIEKAEQAQNNDMKNASKRIKTEQERELKQFRENQKQEMKLLKQEMDLLPRENKKEAAQKMRESKQIEMEQKERHFLEKQTERMETHMNQLANQHRQKIAMLESQCLQQKQHMCRGRESATWEMEKTQLHERHQLAKTQLKDMFFVKRHQMLNRHQKEMDNLKRYNHIKEEEMSNRHTMEKRRLPKIMKSEAKTRAQMFKQSLRLSTVGTPEEDKSKIKQFEESEKKRMKSEQLRQEEKHRRQAKALMDKNEAAVKELENLQAEKRKMLMEQENQKIKELEDQFNMDMKEWKAQLTPRKQALEEQFQSETEEQQSFYSDVMHGDMPASAMQNFRSSAASVRSKASKDGTINSRHSTVI